MLDPKQLDDAVAAGAVFLVSPGASPRLIDAALASPVPFLPGIATAGEAMTLAERGFAALKFFPAEPAGGIAYLKALGAPLPGIRFCPTGGVGAKNAADYLALPNVICVGGSWVAPADALAQGNWTRITALSKEAAQLETRPERRANRRPLTPPQCCRAVMNPLAFVSGCGPYGRVRALPGDWKTARGKIPSLILGEGPDGRDKTLPFPDYKLPTEKGCMSHPCNDTNGKRNPLCARLAP